MIYKDIKIAGIILAAGKSSRLGKSKQILAFKEKTILHEIIKNALNSLLYEIIVVLGHNADKIKKKVDFSKVKVALNIDYKKGQSSSIQKGLKLISDNCIGGMFLLGDQPLISTKVINLLIKEFCNTKACITIPTYKGKRGNPVIIHKKLFYKLKSLKYDTGPRIFFNEFKGEIREVETNDYGINFDVDTQKDYEKLILDYGNK